MTRRWWVRLLATGPVTRKRRPCATGSAVQEQSRKNNTHGDLRWPVRNRDLVWQRGSGASCQRRVQRSATHLASFVAHSFVKVGRDFIAAPQVGFGLPAATGGIQAVASLPDWYWGSFLGLLRIQKGTLFWGSVRVSLSKEPGISVHTKCGLVAESGGQNHPKGFPVKARVPLWVNIFFGF